MIRVALAAIILTGCAQPTVHVGSKKFTESVILGDVAAQLVESAGIRAEHRRELGGTQILFAALEKGEIDAYAEYTGTITEEILPREPDVAAALAKRGILMTAPLGFQNTYAMGMPSTLARTLGVQKISDLARHPDLAFGFSSEFMDRKDGWRAVRDRYSLPQKDVRGLDHDLAYRALASGALAVTELYSTDAEIRHYDLRVLEDDLRVFPEYRAVYLYRADLRTRAPAAVEALLKLEGRIREDDMIGLNHRARIDRVPEPRVAAEFLGKILGVRRGAATDDTRPRRLLRNTGAHLALVGISLAASIVVGIPLGILAARRRRVGQVVLAVVGVTQTIPSLALLVLMIPLLGIGGPPAIVALFLYALLPIVRNTHAGLRDIPVPILESAQALGLEDGARLRKVELPMASRSILAGIKTSAVINVGNATLGAMVGAGGFGQPILTGIRLDDFGLVLEGAIPAAVLALVVQALFEGVERVLVPAGLRLEPAR